MSPLYQIDTDAGELSITDGAETTRVDLWSTDAFEAISDIWLQVGWNQRYSYTFSWLGRPIIQLPEDMVRIQEVIWDLQPDVIIETGVAHGGSAVFIAGLCELAGKGRVIAIDIEIRRHNRTAVEAHPLASRISLIEGDSTSPATIREVSSGVRDDEVVLVVLDSDHSRDHVLGELEAYSPFVSTGSYIVATDGLMRDVAATPRGNPDWVEDNPVSAVEAFLAQHPEFSLEQPRWPFNESELRRNITHWPSAWLRRL